MIPGNRRLAILIGSIVVLIGALVLVLGGGDSSPPRLPEAGSAFGGGRTATSEADVLGGVQARDTSTIAPKPDISTERAVAQLFVIGFTGTTPSAPFFSRLREHDWGGVVLTGGNATGLPQVATLAGAVMRTARAEGHRAPFVVAAADLPGMPPQEPRAASTARSEAEASGRALRGAGVTLALGPVADLGNSGGPAASTAFAPDGAGAAVRTLASVRGWRAGGVAPAVGHFPGQGSASQDPDDGPATVGLGLDELRAADLKPFATVATSTPVVMMSASLYAAFDGVTPATQLPDAVKLLRDTGFRGVVLSANLPAVTLATGRPVSEAAVDALRAGSDLLYVSGDAADQRAAYRAVLKAVRSGAVSAARFRDAYARVRTLKRVYRVQYVQR